MEPYGSENFKTLLLLQITVKSFQTIPEFFPNGPHKNAILDFWNLEFPIFNDFFPKILNSLL